MKIELKNVKTAEFMSEETLCFSATVYVNGKRAFIAKNEGQGGPDAYVPLKGKTYDEAQNAARAVNDALKKESLTLEGVVYERLMDTMRVKEAKRLLKRITYLKNNAVYSLAPKFKPGPRMYEMVREAPWWKPEYTLLNDLPLSKVVDLLRSAD